MRAWKINGPPQPYWSLIFIPLILGINALISLIVGGIFSALSDIAHSNFSYVFGIIFIAIAYSFKDIYLRLFFNFFVWLLKSQGNKSEEKFLFRTFKYSIVTFIIIPGALLIVQGIGFSESLTGSFWFMIVFKNFYIFLILTSLLAGGVEYFIPKNIFKKVDKVYLQKGGLIAKVDW